MIALTALKISMTALLVLFVVFVLDRANGTGEPWQKSPMWIEFPGAVAAVVFIVAGIVGVLALIWGA